MSAETTFNGLPGWAKGVLAVGALGLTAIVGFTVYSKVQSRIAHAGDFAEKADVKDEIKDLAKQNIKPSYSDSQYSTWANQLFAAMDGYGSDFSPIIRVFINMKNNADVLKLLAAYGIREISSGNWNPEPNFKGTLTAALTNQLNAKEIAEINIALAKRAITIKF